MAANSSMEFHPGDEVEVAIIAEGFENSYYPATVISKVEGSSTRYKVRYRTLLTEDNFAQLEEFVEARQIRPTPPHVSVSCFSLHELVDVWENDGWWAGIIYGNFQSKYFLYHPATEEEKSYNLDQLRVHQEWINGQWIRGQPAIAPTKSPEKKKKQRRSKKPKEEKRSKRAKTQSATAP